MPLHRPRPCVYIGGEAGWQGLWRWLGVRQAALSSAYLLQCAIRRYRRDRAGCIAGCDVIISQAKMLRQGVQPVLWWSGMCSDDMW